MLGVPDARPSRPAVVVLVPALPRPTGVDRGKTAVDLGEEAGANRCAAVGTTRGDGEQRRDEDDPDPAHTSGISAGLVEKLRPGRPPVVGPGDERQPVLLLDAAPVPVLDEPVRGRELDLALARPARG